MDAGNTDPLTDLLQQRSAATRSSTGASRRSPSSSSSALLLPADPGDDSGTVIASGGDYEGETIEPSYLSDSAFTAFSPGPGRMGSGSTTPRGGQWLYKVIWYTREMWETTCGGKIVSVKNDYACAKDCEVCDVKAHAKKHSNFTSDKIYLVGIGKSKEGNELGDKRIINPLDFSIPTHSIMLKDIKPLIASTNIKLKETSSEKQATKVFKVLNKSVMKIQQAKVLSKAEELSKQRKSDNELSDLLGLKPIVEEDQGQADIDEDIEFEGKTPDELFEELDKAMSTEIQKRIKDFEGVVMDAMEKEVLRIQKDITSKAQEVVRNENEKLWMHGKGKEILRDVESLKDKDSCEKYSTDNPCPCCNDLRRKVTLLEIDNSLLKGQMDSLNETNLGEGNEDASEKITELTYQISLMNARIGSTCLQFGDVMLQSLGDTGLFVNDHIPSNSFGCFFDLIALMDAPRDCNLDQETFVKSLHNAEKAKFASNTEVSTSASFLHVTPLCFCKSMKQDTSLIHGSVDKMLHMVKNREMWYSRGGLEGLKQDLSREIKEQVNSVQAEIRHTLGDSKGAYLAREFLVASQNCYNDFVNWTESFYNELTAMEACTDNEAWRLVLECWLAFFVDLRSIRMECASVSMAGMELNSNKRKHVVARYIWIMGRAIKVQEEYRERQFRNHPTISTVLNYHLFQHRVPTSTFNNTTTQLKEEIKTFYTWKSQVNRDIKVLQAKKT